MTSIWTEESREQLRSLQAIQAERTLTDTEELEIKRLFALLDADEAGALSMGRRASEERQSELQQKNDVLRREIADLERIQSEHEHLLTEARSYLANLRARRLSLADEFRRAASGAAALTQ